MKILKAIKEVWLEFDKVMNEPYVFINTCVAIGLVGFGIFVGYLWFAPI